MSNKGEKSIINLYIQNYAVKYRKNTQERIFRAHRFVRELRNEETIGYNQSFLHALAIS